MQISYGNTYQQPPFVADIERGMSRRPRLDVPLPLVGIEDSGSLLVERCDVLEAGEVLADASETGDWLPLAEELYVLPDELFVL